MNSNEGHRQKFNETTNSMRRVQQLSQQMQKTTKLFNPNNFLDNSKNIDIDKLRKRIAEAKNKISKTANQNESKEGQSRQLIDKKIKLEKFRRFHKKQNNILIDDIEHIKKSRSVNDAKSINYYGNNIKKTAEVYLNPYKNKANAHYTIQQHHRNIYSNGDSEKLNKKRSFSRNTEYSQQSKEHLLPYCKWKITRPKTNISKYQQQNQSSVQYTHNRKSKKSINKQKQKRRRLATDLQSYATKKRYTIDRSEDNHQNIIARKKLSVSRLQQPKNKNRQSIVKNENVNVSRTLLSAEIRTPRKLILGSIDQLHNFQFKILMLWELYEEITLLTQQLGTKYYLSEEKILNYIERVTSDKYQFIYDLIGYFPNSRIHRTIKLSRILQNLSIFQVCLNLIGKKKIRQTEIINILGYSSSSIIFIIKLFFLCHQTSMKYSESVLKILAIITNFQQKSYKAKLTDCVDILRRIEHNNQIISMLKGRCGRKHGKYCQQFISQTIKTYERTNPLFCEGANNIFQFLAFYLHFQNIAYKLPILSLPPTPFLNLRHPRTIIIQPWGVLAYKKQDKLLIRAHTSIFLNQILNGINHNTIQGNIANQQSQIRTNQSPVSITQNIEGMKYQRNHIKEEDMQSKLTNSITNNSKLKFNLIFWTQLMPKEADILADLMPQHEDVYWLYKYHCYHALSKNNNSRRSLKKSQSNSYLETQNYNIIKNIECTGSDVENTIIIDNSNENFKNNLENGIQLKWKGQKRDIKLLQCWEIINKISHASQNGNTTLKQELAEVRNQIQVLERGNKPKIFKRSK